jgi:predicted amidohydrolase
MRSLAKANAAITGSVVIEENSNFITVCYLFSIRREIQHYDKRHLFTLAGEDKFIQRQSKIDCRVPRLEDLSVGVL